MSKPYTIDPALHVQAIVLLVWRWLRDAGFMPWNSLALLTELLQVSMQLHAKHLHAGTLSGHKQVDTMREGKKLCTADKTHGRP